MPNKKSLIPVERIASRILVLRGKKVILDTDLAELYGVATKRLNEQVKRNKARFPSDFLFQLNLEEKNDVVAICDHLEKLKYSKSLPYAYTEHGAIMAASVLNTEKAVKVSIYVVRAFIKLRGILVESKKYEERFAEIEMMLSSHDEKIKTLLVALKQLMSDHVEPRRITGFRGNNENCK